MSRAEYREARRVARSMRPMRSELGLPAHPDGSGWVVCPDCDGAGEHVRNDSHIGDPQCEYEVNCSRCHGDGSLVDGPRDPILQLRRAHELARYGSRADPFNRIHYGVIRQRVVSPVALPDLSPTPQPNAWPLAA